MRNQNDETTSEAICEDCGRPIPAGDIQAFQFESGTDDLPRCCGDCAEEPEPARGCTCHLLPQTDMDGCSFTGLCRYCDEQLNATEQTEGEHERSRRRGGRRVMA